MSDGRSDVSRMGDGTQRDMVRNEWLSRVGDQSTTKHPPVALWSNWCLFHSPVTVSLSSFPPFLFCHSTKTTFLKHTQEIKNCQFCVTAKRFTTFDKFLRVTKWLMLGGSFKPMLRARLGPYQTQDQTLNNNLILERHFCVYFIVEEHL